MLSNYDPILTYYKSAMFVLNSREALYSQPRYGKGSP
jgi:hypothetical protein